MRTAPPAEVYVERHVHMARGVRRSPKMPEMVSKVAPRSWMYSSAVARGVLRSGVRSSTFCPGVSTW